MSDAVTATLSPGTVQQNVLIGLDGYFFLHHGGQRQFDFLTGECQPTVTDIHNFFANLAGRKNFCDARNIAFLHLVFPSKPVIMKEKVPSPWREKLQSLLLSQYFARHPAAIPDQLIYPLPLLQQLAAQGTAFPRHDTHNTMSSLLAIVLSVLHRLDLAYDPADYFAQHQSQRLGDLAKMLGLTEKETEVVPKALFTPLYFDNLSALPANSNNVSIMFNPDATSTRRLLIFGDSFIKMALIFFAPVFRDIVYVRCATFQPEMVEMFGADVVISSNAERYLSAVESDEQAQPFLFQLYGNPTYQPDQTFIAAFKAQFSYRYHPDLYQRWLLTLSDHELSDPLLGGGTANSQIKILNKDTGFFHSAGEDPYFTFSQPKLQQGRHYQVEFNLASEFASYCKVYFSTSTTHADFTEAQTLRVPVAPGDNQISFVLQPPASGCPLRLDPIACAGHFVLSNLRVSEIAVAQSGSANTSRNGQ